MVVCHKNKTKISELNNLNCIYLQKQSARLKTKDPIFSKDRIPTHDIKN